MDSRLRGNDGVEIVVPAKGNDDNSKFVIPANAGIQVPFGNENGFPLEPAPECLNRGRE